MILLIVLTTNHGIISHDMEVFNESHFQFYFEQILTFDFGAAVAQWVKSWPADLITTSLIPRGGNLFHLQKAAHSCSVSSCHGPDMTEILLKRT